MGAMEIAAERIRMLIMQLQRGKRLEGLFWRDSVEGASEQQEMETDGDQG
jgi:hypothetical protein